MRMVEDTVQRKAEFLQNIPLHGHELILPRGILQTPQLNRGKRRL